MKKTKKTKKPEAKADRPETEGSDGARFDHIVVDRPSPETEELIREHAELEARIRAIEELTGAPTAPTARFMSMPELDRILLLNQLAAMSTYEYNLNIRTSRAVARDAEAQRG